MKLNKDDTYALFDAHHIVYESYEHDAAYTIENLDSLNIPHKEWIVKNLFLRDDIKEITILLPSRDIKRKMM